MAAVRPPTALLALLGMRHVPVIVDTREPAPV